MNDKKHIDRLFQESFKNFEAVPDDAVWENIEAKLKDKKKRRVIPIWWRYAGVAALVLLLLTVGGVYFNTANTTSTHQIADEDESTSPKDILTKEDPTLNNSFDSNNRISTVNDLEKNNEVVSHDAAKSSTIIKSNTISVDKNLVAKNTQTSEFDSNNIVDSKETASTLNVSSKNSPTVASTNLDQNTDRVEYILIDEAKQQKHIQEASGNNVSLTLADNEKKATINQPENTSNATSDLTIEEAIDKNKDVITSNIQQNRWSIAPSIAPVYFNTLNEGSSIDGQFNTNSKTGEVNMSYGISTSYAINKKFKVRSGINKVNLGYNTNDVVVFQSSGTSSSTLKNVNEGANTLGVTSDQALENTSTAPNFAVSTDASINQSFGYIEVPLEIQYTFVDRRLGVNVIGGFSSFFLDNNEIYSESGNGTRTYLGEANNINDISYSANLGLGLNYRFSKKIDLNLEPTFKYQFNTFNNTSGDFTPFFIGVYTGFAIKF